MDKLWERAILLLVNLEFGKHLLNVLATLEVITHML